MKETKLTKVPVNKRVDALERAGLIRRWRGTGSVEITEFGKFFVEKI